MHRPPSSQAGQTSRFRLIATAAVIALPVTAATVWWVTPASKPPNTSMDDHMRQVRAAAATSGPLGVGTTVSLPEVEGWLNPDESAAKLGPRITVLDFTTLW